MYEYITGRIVSLNPAYVIIETHGFAYRISISLTTYESISKLTDCKLLLHFNVREDIQQFFGFFSEEERALFRDLISVSGIGPGTAIMLLSSLKPSDVVNAIISANVSLLKSIKGIGPKTAQRIIVELQDNMKKSGKDLFMPVAFNNQVFDEAVSALVMLGFKRTEAEKSVNNIIKTNKENLTSEQIIKLSLKGM